MDDTFAGVVFGPSFAVQRGLLQRQPLQSSWLQLLRGQRVLVYGVGRSGGGLLTATALRRHGADVRLLDAVARDQHPFGMEADFPWYSMAQLGAARRFASLVVPAPGLPPTRLRFWSRTQRLTPEGLFLLAHRGRRVAITGSKGKSTTAMLTAAILKWPVVGNTFGHLLVSLAQHGSFAPVICEWSSFQLHHWWQSLLYRVSRPIADVGVVTNVMSDHLDWHGNLAAYQRAKAILPENCIKMVDDVVTDISWRDSRLFFHDSKVLDAAHFSLLGDHNKSNAVLAAAAAVALGADGAAIAAGLRQAQSLPHRLQVLCNSEAGLLAIDDSQATTPDAAAAAVRTVAAMTAGPMLLLLGGVDKGGDRRPLAAALRDFPRPVQVATYGSSAASWTAWLQAIKVPVLTGQSLAHVLTDKLRAAWMLNGRHTILLAPACASHDQFTDYRQRGLEFARLLGLRHH